jgi:hypothetical protein
MGNDLPDDADVPPDEHSDQPAGRADATREVSEPSDRPRGTQAEIRDRDEYYSDLRAAVAEEGQGEAAEEWDKCAERSRAEWADHLRRWPADKQAPVDRSGDPPGSWRGDSNRFLDRADNEYVEEQCRQIAQTERDTISPAMRAIESCDSGRKLIGFEHCLKDRDRIKDKVAEQIKYKFRTVEHAFATVKDTVRYTFQYGEANYSAGVWADIQRLKTHGFEEVERRNSWTADQYKGINSWWRVPGSVQIFEVQFHTLISFEAKQLTHVAYKRLRNPLTSDAEREELSSFQKRVSGSIRVPPGATGIPDYP